MLRILLNQSRIDRSVIKLLRKAHYQRNLLVHRFMLENIRDVRSTRVSISGIPYAHLKKPTEVVRET